MSRRNLQNIVTNKIQKASSNNCIHNIGQRASGGVPILILKIIPQIKINMYTHLQETAVLEILHINVSISLIYISLVTP